MCIWIICFNFSQPILVLKITQGWTYKQQESSEYFYLLLSMLKVLQESGQGNTENSTFKLAAHTL